jgi:hypothetical protein
LFCAPPALVFAIGEPEFDVSTIRYDNAFMLQPAIAFFTTAGVVPLPSLCK